MPDGFLDPQIQRDIEGAIVILQKPGIIIPTQVRDNELSPVELEEVNGKFENKFLLAVGKLFSDKITSTIFMCCRTEHDMVLNEYWCKLACKVGGSEKFIFTIDLKVDLDPRNMKYMTGRPQFKTMETFIQEIKGSPEMQLDGCISSELIRMRKDGPQRILSFVMGSNRRLGASSPLNLLDVLLVDKIARMYDESGFLEVISHGVEKGREEDFFETLM